MLCNRVFIVRIVRVLQADISSDHSIQNSFIWLSWVKLIEVVDKVWIAIICLWSNNFWSVVLLVTSLSLPDVAWLRYVGCFSLVDWADVVEATAGDEVARGGVSACHHPGGAQGDCVHLFLLQELDFQTKSGQVFQLLCWWSRSPRRWVCHLERQKPGFESPHPNA